MVVAKFCARLKQLMQSDDPMQVAANRIALFVGSSQLFYPLGVVWLIGPAGWGASLAWLTTPLFLAVPFVGHRWSGGGRLLLIVAGTLATLLVSLRLGPDTLVEVYDLPLLIAALALFRAGESRLRSAALAMPVLEWLIVHVPPGDRDWISTAELLWGLHLGGAGVLSFLIAHYGLVRLRRIEGPGGNLPSGPCA